MVLPPHSICSTFEAIWPLAENLKIIHFGLLLFGWKCFTIPVSSPNKNAFEARPKPSGRRLPQTMIFPKSLFKLDSIPFDLTFGNKRDLDCDGEWPCSVDSSVPSIQLPLVRVTSTPSMLFSIYIVQIVYLSFELKCGKNNIKKEAAIAPYFF